MAKIFLTGGTGFIGKRLVPKLADNNEVSLLVRPQSLSKARDLISKQKLKNVKIVVGDLEEKGLGLSQKDKSTFADFDYVFHLAASYDPKLAREQTFEIILSGTKRLASLFEKSKKLRSFVYVSTAHVAGLRNGRIFEDRLVKPKAFHNPYEEAKFQSEVFIKKTSLPWVIIRPAMVVGDSRTGEFDKEVKSGVYQLIKAVDRGFLFFYPGECLGFIPAVPVDWVTETIYKIGLDKKSLGKTFHLVDAKPLTTLDFIGRVCELLGKPKPLFTLPLSFFNLLPPMRLKNQILMLNQRQIFDMKNTISLIGKKNLAPQLVSYLPILIRYYKENLG